MQVASKKGSVNPRRVVLEPPGSKKRTEPAELVILRIGVSTGIVVVEGNRESQRESKT